jgi:hypothetical protein
MGLCVSFSTALPDGTQTIRYPSLMSYVRISSSKPSFQKSNKSVEAWFDCAVIRFYLEWVVSSVKKIGKKGL